MVLNDYCDCAFRESGVFAAFNPHTIFKLLGVVVDFRVEK